MPFVTGHGRLPLLPKKSEDNLADSGVAASMLEPFETGLASGASLFSALAFAAAALREIWLC